MRIKQYPANTKFRRLELGGGTVMIMLVVALVLFAVAVVLAVAVLVAGAEPVEFDVFNVTVDTTLGIVFLAGVIAGFALLAAIAAMIAGTRRVRTRRREVRSLRRKVAKLEGEAPAPAHADEPAHPESPDDRLDRRAESAQRVSGQS
jgi:uncharacterized integral membrane protein